MNVPASEIGCRDTVVRNAGSGLIPQLLCALRVGPSTNEADLEVIVPSTNGTGRRCVIVMDCQRAE